MAWSGDCRVTVTYEFYDDIEICKIKRKEKTTEKDTKHAVIHYAMMEEG